MRAGDTIGPATASYLRRVREGVPERRAPNLRCHTDLLNLDPDRARLPISSLSVDVVALTDRAMVSPRPWIHTQVLARSFLGELRRRHGMHSIAHR